MPLLEWKERYKDVGDADGFQFRFFCENCQSPYDTQYVKGNFNIIGTIMGGFIAIMGYILVGALMNALRGDRDGHDSWGGGYGLLSGTGEAVVTGALGASSFGTGISGSLRRRKARKYLRTAQMDAHEHFISCMKCERLVCSSCYNEDLALCTKCALCPSCGQPIKVGKFCQSCGKPYSFSGYTCPSCLEEIPQGLKFCSKCGVPLPAASSTPPSIESKGKH
jgi:hypothetical protein